MDFAPNPYLDLNIQLSNERRRLSPPEQLAGSVDYATVALTHELYTVANAKNTPNIRIPLFTDSALPRQLTRITIREPQSLNKYVEKY